MAKSKPTTNVSPWPVKGVDRDTRTAIKKAAQKEQKTLGEFFNTTLRQYSQSIIQSKPMPPMKIEEVATDVEQLKSQMAAIMERLDEPQSFWDRLFANKKKRDVAEGNS